jgi:lipopolysaccharide transport system permease protein
VPPQAELIDEVTPPGAGEATAPEAPGAEPTQADDLPLTVIERQPGWHLVNLRELWRFRELLYILIWRDVKVRYKQTVLGGAWAVMQPLATMAAFSLFLGRVASSEGAELAYPLFVFTGLLPWTFFTAAVSAAAMSVVADERLITKVYFPRLLVPGATVIAKLLDLAISFAILLVMMPFFAVWPGLGFLALPLIVLVLLSLALGLGVLLSALTVAYRDVKVIVPLALQMWMFATPAIFLQDLSVLGPGMRAFLPFNPLHGAIVNFRAAIVGGPFDWPSLAISAAMATVMLLLGSFYFRRVERAFADII